MRPFPLLHMEWRVPQSKLQRKSNTNWKFDAKVIHDIKTHARRQMSSHISGYFLRASQSGRSNMHLPSVITKSNQSNYKLEKLQNKRTKTHLPRQKAFLWVVLYLSLAVKIINKNKFWLFFFYFSKILSRKSIAFSTKHKHLTLIYPSKSGEKKKIIQIHFQIRSISLLFAQLWLEKYK